MTDNNQKTVLINPLVLLLILAALIIGYLYFSLNKSDSNAVVNNQQQINNSQDASDTTQQTGFLGETGDTVQADNNIIYIDETEVNDRNIHYYNYYSDKQNKTIYFFIIKAPDNTFRAAANACEVCYGSKKGFKQVGDLIRCENCQTTYTKDKIAKEKGGCNPGPINDNVKVENNKLVINEVDLENVAYLF